MLGLLGRIREGYSSEKAEEVEAEERAVEAHGRYLNEL